jgi:hypothetical protein
MCGGETVKARRKYGEANCNKRVAEQGARPNIPVRYFMILIRKGTTYS